MHRATENMSLKIQINALCPPRTDIAKLGT
jgi:hypothetical protein